MKTVEMQPTQFHQFKQKANDIRLWFDYKITNSIVYVTADEHRLEELGY